MQMYSTHLCFKGKCHILHVEITVQLKIINVNTYFEIFIVTYAWFYIQDVFCHNTEHYADYIDIFVLYMV